MNENTIDMRQLVKFVCVLICRFAYDKENYDDIGKHFARKTVWFRESNKFAHDKKCVYQYILI